MELVDIANDPNVEYINLDYPVKLQCSIANSVPWIRASELHNQGDLDGKIWNGAKVSVGLMDTGVGSAPNVLGVNLYPSIDYEFEDDGYYFYKS